MEDDDSFPKSEGWVKKKVAIAWLKKKRLYIIYTLWTGFNGLIFDMFGFTRSHQSICEKEGRKKKKERVLAYTLFTFSHLKMTRGETDIRLTTFQSNSFSL